MKGPWQEQSNLVINFLCLCLSCLFLWVIFNLHLSHTILSRVAKFCQFSSFLQMKEGAICFPFFCHYFLFLHDLQMLTVCLDQILKGVILWS